MIYQLELEDDALHGGRGGHLPLAAGLGDLHGGGGGRGGLPHDQTEAELDEELVVLLGRLALVLAGDLDHFDLVEDATGSEDELTLTEETEL